MGVEHLFGMPRVVASENVKGSWVRTGKAVPFEIDLAIIARITVLNHAKRITVRAAHDSRLADSLDLEVNVVSVARVARGGPRSVSWPPVTNVPPTSQRKCAIGVGSGS
jgi:hypothetical protein